MKTSNVENLRRRRIALIGFEAAQAKSITDALLDCDALPQVVKSDQAIVGLNRYTYYDVCIVSCDNASEIQLPLEQIKVCHRPVLLVGDFEAVTETLQLVSALKNDFVLRPFRHEEVLLKADRLARDEAPIDTGDPSERRRVLIVDDEPKAAILTEAILRLAGFECEIARDGLEAIEIARHRTPDVVILDVVMPRLDGFGTLAVLRKDPEFHRLPIIMVSADLTESDIVRGLQLGADDYVVKPYNPNELVARIDRTLRDSVLRKSAHL